MGMKYSLLILCIIILQSLICGCLSPTISNNNSSSNTSAVNPSTLSESDAITIAMENSSAGLRNVSISAELIHGVRFGNKPVWAVTVSGYPINMTPEYYQNYCEVVNNTIVTEYPLSEVVYVDSFTGKVILIGSSL